MAKKRSEIETRLERIEAWLAAIAKKLGVRDPAKVVKKPRVPPEQRPTLRELAETTRRRARRA